MPTTPSAMVQAMFRRMPGIYEAEIRVAEALAGANTKLCFKGLRDELFNRLKNLQLQTRADRLRDYIHFYEVQSLCDINYALGNIRDRRRSLDPDGPIIRMMERATQLLADEYFKLVDACMRQILRETLGLIFFKQIMEEMQMFPLPPPVSQSANWKKLQAEVQAAKHALAVLNTEDSRELESKLTEARAERKIYERCWTTCRLGFRIGNVRPSNFVRMEVKRQAERNCTRISDILQRLDTRETAYAHWLQENRRAESFWFLDVEGRHDYQAIQDHRRLSETLEAWTRELEAVVQSLRAEYVQLQNATVVSEGV